MCRFVGYKHGRTDQDAVWDLYLGGPKEPSIRWGNFFLGGGRGAVKNVQSDSSRCVQCWYLHVNTGIIFVLSAFANTDRSFIDNVMLVWLDMLDGNNLLTSACPSVFLIKQYLSTLYAIEKPSVL